jgi:hypothetical protein
MKYVLTKSHLSTNIVTILFISDSYSACINFLHEYIENNFEKNTLVTYVKDSNRIFQYKKSLGYIYNDKELENVFQICFFSD